MSLSPMSHVEFNKCQCRCVDFRGLGPYITSLTYGVLGKTSSPIEPGEEGCPEMGLDPVINISS